ncbi:MAG: leucyl/phenylalanyl-tRNA--protein transferase [Kiritimatiellia bacterium]
MHADAPPSREDFQRFFRNRLEQLQPTQELIWISDVVPTEALAAGYPLGIFPWPGDDPDLFPWVCPRVRGVLCLDKFHLGKSTRRQLRRADFIVTMDTCFPEIIEACHRAHEPESWIHPQMREAYTLAWRQGLAHSVEVRQNGVLVGGLYGMDSGHFFSGESMFHRVPNAGKAAIQYLVEHLKQRGDRLLDIQQLTPHMKALGAENWPRRQFFEELQVFPGN